MYNKLFQKILDSSIWMESDTTRLVWLTFLAAMDETGYAHFSSVANLAHRARVELEACQKALAVLEGPDAESADTDYEGRRIERVPGGWLVLNAPKYREIVSRENARERTRERVARHRQKKRAVTVSNEKKQKVTTSDTEAEADTETYVKHTKAEKAKKEGLAAVAQQVRDEWGKA